MRHTLLTLGTLLFGCLSASALELPEIIGSNMMLQQQTQARLWGWAKGGSSVTVTTSWDNQTYSAKADRQSGRWELQVPTPAASYDAQQLTIQGDGQTINVDNILIGEVWFCSGQSNMEMPLRGFWNCPVEGATEAIATSAQYKKSVRMATIPKIAADTPQDRVPGKWQTCEPQNAREFSAVGYFFARTLTDMLDVPVGIINCSWGGSTVEGWLPREILETYPDGIVPFNDGDWMRKMVMHNGMLAPLAGYTVKGFLWNQGESNIGREEMYQERFTAMVNLWRQLWQDDSLPIYTVELPGYWYDDAQDEKCARFRDVQHKIAHELQNSGCVCTTDLILPYEAKQIHGTKKLEIGQRLAYMAATRDYGVKGIEAEAPEFWRAKVVDAQPGELAVVAGSKVAENPNEKGKIVQLYFHNGADGFDRLEDIEGFEAAGADGLWHPAIVWAATDYSDPNYTGCMLRLICPEAGEVKAVRYNYHNFISTHSLHNCWGLPLVPFTTTL